MKRIVISIANSFDRDRRMIRSVKALRGYGYTVQIIDKSSDHITCWFSKGILFYLEFNLRLIIKLLSTKPDILLSVDTDTLLANTLISKIKKKPLVIDMHELFTEVPELTGHPMKKAIWGWIERVGISQSYKRYTVGQTIADEYKKRYGKAFEIVRNVPVSQPLDLSTEKAQRFTLVYLGAVNLGRGLIELIKAVSKVKNVDLAIYGTGDLDAEIQSLIRELNLSKRVLFKGWIDPNDIPTLLRKAHVGVNLLDPSSQSYYLSLANKYFDYIHAGLPILTMNFPEYKALNSEHQTSILVDDLTESRIIDAILGLKNNTDLYNKLAANCQVANQKWNWESESKRLLSVFDL